MASFRLLRFRSFTTRSYCASASVKNHTREPRDLHAAWASLAAYDSVAAGPYMNKQAEEAKRDLQAAGYELATEFVVAAGKATSFDGSKTVDETDAAYLWIREADGRGMLAFRGSDTQEDLEHVRDPRTVFMYGHHVHAGVAEHELAPLVAKMTAADFAQCNTLAIAGCGLFDGFGQDRKMVDELYGFGATPVFHNTEPETANHYQCGKTGGAFIGAIYRAIGTSKGREVQDRAFTLASQDFHYPKTNLVSLFGPSRSPEVVYTSKVRGTPGWRNMVADHSLDEQLFPLHNPVNYVKWLGTMKKKTKARL